MDIPYSSFMSPYYFAAKKEKKKNLENSPPSSYLICWVSLDHQYIFENFKGE